MKQLSREGITVTLDKRLRQAFCPQPQHTSAMGSIEAAGSKGGLLEGGLAGDQQHSWRLDKDDVASVFVRLRRNLMGEQQLLLPQAPF